MTDLADQHHAPPAHQRSASGSSELQPARKSTAASPRHDVGGTGTLEIGLVNNMPDAALRRTERQFMGLIEAAASGRPVRFSLLALPGVTRQEPYRSYTAAAYRDLSALGPAQATLPPLDAIIVTGAEPRAADLRDEPYWPAFTRLVDWAAENTLSTFWSCLAAHAAVQHLDGIRRRRFAAKLSGVLMCERVGGHPLMSGLPTRFAVPHSRYNGLDPAELTAAGYETHSRTSCGGVDVFTKPAGSNASGSLFVFAQGHPEYDTNSLLKEYRRDVRRYLRFERPDLPARPSGYLSEEADSALDTFEQVCREHRSESVMTRFPTGLAEATLVNTWRREAVAMMRNWLQLIADRKAARAAAGPASSIMGP
jgi:homoserine O-succinyltransferase